MTATIHAILRLAAALWLGGVALFTFVLTPALFRRESRDMAGHIVGVLFPGYFRWGLACGAVALAALLTLRVWSRVPHFAAAAALVALMMTATAFQAFYVEPKAAAIKQQIPSFDTTPKDDPARQAFSRLHAVSAVLNLAVCGGGVVLVLLL